MTVDGYRSCKGNSHNTFNRGSHLSGKDDITVHSMETVAYIARMTVTTNSTWLDYPTSRLGLSQYFQKIQVLFHTGQKITIHSSQSITDLKSDNHYIYID